MKASQYLLPTTKEDPQDAVVASHRLMIRAGLIRKLGSGLYHYLPMGLRVLRKIESLIREEMNASGGLEFQLPILTPAEIWNVSGRWDKMGKEMFRLKDRHDNWNCLGPTHEESFSALMKTLLKSYKDLPVNVYQIHTKFRDEIRPRFGVIRSREFIMKDSYSFHLDEESLEETYQLMRATYRKIFHRMGLNTVPVQADSGNMGGSKSEEFIVLSPVGEETLMVCKSCGYSGNVEKTPLVAFYPLQEGIQRQNGEKVHTPNLKSIQDLANFFQILPSQCLKTIALVSDGNPVLVFLSGDRDLNETKLRNYLGSNEIRAMGNQEMIQWGLVAGFIGPMESYPNGFRVIVDRSVDFAKQYIVGANQIDTHFKNFIWGTNKEEVADISLTRDGDPCPECGASLKSEKGIEVGHIFQLGRKYTEAFEMNVLDANGKSRLVTMGCYGIGVNRCMATIIEQCNDEKGILWPISVAPFEICIVSIAKTSEDIAKVEAVYRGLVEKDFEIFWDDRNLGAGFKFKDSELIGFPIRITLGKSFLENNEVSILNRKTGQEQIHKFSGIDSLAEVLSQLRRELFRELEV